MRQRCVAPQQVDARDAPACPDVDFTLSRRGQTVSGLLNAPPDAFAAKAAALAGREASPRARVVVAAAVMQNPTATTAQRLAALRLATSASSAEPVRDATSRGRSVALSVRDAGGTMTVVADPATGDLVALREQNPDGSVTAEQVVEVNKDVRSVGER